jgi:hypothetical protein
MLRQAAGLNQSDPACPANRRRCEAIAFAGCTVLAVAHRKGKEKAISGWCPHPDATDASRYVNAPVAVLSSLDQPSVECRLPEQTRPL